MPSTATTMKSQRRSSLPLLRTTSSMTTDDTLTMSATVQSLQQLPPTPPRSPEVRRVHGLAPASCKPIVTSKESLQLRCQKQNEIPTVPSPVSAGSCASVSTYDLWQRISPTRSSTAQSTNFNAQPSPTSTTIPVDIKLASTTSQPPLTLSSLSSSSSSTSGSADASSSPSSIPANRITPSVSAFPSPSKRKVWPRRLVALQTASKPAVVHIVSAETRRVENNSGKDAVLSRWFQTLGLGLGVDQAPTPSNSLLLVKNESSASPSESTNWLIREDNRQMLFTVYQVTVQAADQSWSIDKRYSDFHLLDKAIQKQFPFLHKQLPDLPPKRLFLWDHLDAEFVQIRLKGLDLYMQHVLSRPLLLRSPLVCEFLCSSAPTPNNSLQQEQAAKRKNGSSVNRRRSTGESSTDSSSSSDSSSESGEEFTFQQKPDTALPEGLRRRTDKSLKLTGPRDERPLSPTQSWLRSGGIRTAFKGAIRTSRLGDTLKRVAWRKTLFEVKSISRSESDGLAQEFNSLDQSALLCFDSEAANDQAYKKESDDLFDAVIHSGGDTPRRSALDEALNSSNCVTMDDFHLLKLIGKGNFGKVMLAQHKDNSHVYAIKVISKSSLRKSKSKTTTLDQRVDRIMTERNVLIHSVKHPFLVGLNWSFQTPEKLYFVTEYVNGGELFFHLQKEHRFSELRARFYAAEIVSALAYLHTQVDVIYRDLKPENILLDASGHIKLTDFGLAKENFYRKSRGRTRTFCGTPEYMAPEILRKEQYGFAVDWWCLGAILYEMLSGLPPFYHEDSRIMYERILNDKLRFPPFVGMRARSLISGLLNRLPSFRLGTGTEHSSAPDYVKAHPFFEGLDWTKLERLEYTPPFIPQVSHMFDVRNIDPEFVNEPIPTSILEDSAIAAETRMNALPFDVMGLSSTATKDSFNGFTFIGDSHLAGDIQNESETI